MQSRKTAGINTLTIVMMIILISAAVSFILAYFTQSIQNAVLSGKSEVTSISPIASSSIENFLEDNAPEGESELSSSKSSTNSQKPPNADALTFGVPVPESGRAKSNYFDDAMFIGDSITSGIELYDLAQKSVVLAATGLGLENTDKPIIKVGEQYMDLMTAMNGHNPKKIYIMLGMNNLDGSVYSVLIKNYASLLEQIKQLFPDAIIFVQSVLPVTKEKSESGTFVTNQDIDSFNQMLLEMSLEKQVYYLDIASTFKDETGSLPNQASAGDGIHLTTLYYSKWFDFLKTHTIAMK